MGKSTAVNAETWLPRYRQVAEGIRSYIKEHRLPPGSRLPGGRFFAGLFNASKNTVYEALEHLQNEDVIDIRPDSGSYVANGVWTDFIKNSPNWDNFISCGWRHERSPVLHDLANGASDRSNVYLSLASLHSSFGYNKIAKKAMEEILLGLEDSDRLNIYEVQGRASFRSLIARRLAGRGIDVSPSNIIVTCGVFSSLNLLFMALMGRGDTIYTEAPSALSSMTIASSIGINIVAVPTDGEGISVEELKRCVRRSKRAILVVTPFHHGPSETTMSALRRAELMDFCRSVDMPVIEIDAIGDLASSRIRPLKAMDTNNRVIYIGSVLLPYTIGMDVSWIVVPDYLTEHITDISSQMAHYPFNLNNCVVERMLENGSYDRFLEEVRLKLSKRWLYTDKLLVRYMADIAVWDKTPGRYSFWLKLRDDVNIKKMLKNNRGGVVCASGEMYDKKYSRYFSILPYALSEKDLELGISRFAGNARDSIE